MEREPEPELEPELERGLGLEPERDWERELERELELEPERERELERELMTISIIERYLREQETAWSPTTLKSERARLRGILELSEPDPAKLFIRMQEEAWKPYTIKTAFIRLTHLEKTLGESWGYGEFLRKHRNRFKHAYTKEDLSMTYDQALAALARTNPETREMALCILQTGIRLAEAYTAIDGSVTGKGSKPRRIYGKVKATVPRTTFWAQLKAVGLKPHTLRKLCATRLAERGASAADLCKVFGWTSIQTAYQYLQAKDDERLEEMMK